LFYFDVSKVDFVSQAAIRLLLLVHSRGSRASA
jgi:hypothetical protein